jgi:hypothetical protein
VTVRFEHWYDIEDYRDGGNVSVSTNDGASWTVLEPTGHEYNEPNIHSSYSPPRNESGFSDDDETWRTSTIDLTPYVGEPDVRLRFVFGSEESISRGGWYIDTVEIEVN